MPQDRGRISNPSPNCRGHSKLTADSAIDYDNQDFILTHVSRIKL